MILCSPLVCPGCSRLYNVSITAASRQQGSSSAPSISGGMDAGAKCKSPAARAEREKSARLIMETGILFFCIRVSVGFSIDFHFGKYGNSMFIFMGVCTIPSDSGSRQLE